MSRLKFATFKGYFKNKAEAEILKRMDIILCVDTTMNTVQFYECVHRKTRQEVIQLKSPIGFGE